MVPAHLRRQQQCLESKAHPRNHVEWSNAHIDISCTRTVTASLAPSAGAAAASVLLSSAIVVRRSQRARMRVRQLYFDGEWIERIHHGESVCTVVMFG